MSAYRSGFRKQRVHWSAAESGNGKRALDRFCGIAGRCISHTCRSPTRQGHGLHRVRGDCEGQMTVEFVVAFPAMLAIALVAMNALLFFSECASFDRLARQSICVHAAAPAYGKGGGQIAADIQSELQASFDREWLQVEVEASGASLGHARYTATLGFTPTLFGRSFSGNAFGVRISPLEHQVSMVVDPYRPGAIV